MVPNVKVFRIIQWQIRHFHNSPRLAAVNHYDILGLTPKATQADVKSAYYKLSMTYHPDKNKGSEDASNKFRDITAAYEVLGNVSLRKLYDKGMITGSSTTSQGFSSPKEDPNSKFYKSRAVRSQPPHPSGRQTIYDFDEWSRAHYGATFRRDQMNKKNRSFDNQRKIDIENEIKVERVVFSVLILLILCWYLTLNLDYDEVETKQPSRKQNKTVKS